MFGYRVPAPDQAMLISGGRRGQGGAPFRVVTGHGKFVFPVFRKTRFLTLSMQEAEVSETCVTKQGIALTVTAVIAFKVGNDPESIVNAGQRFLSDQNQMSTLTARIFAGHLRSIIGSMTVEEIVTERQKLAEEVLDTSKSEMGKIGLTVDSLQIMSIDDMKTGYIDAMAAPHKAAIQRQAQIAQAQATQASVEAQQEAERLRVQAEAAASYDRVALDRMIIDQLPLIVEKAAGGLNGANINVLNGADGLSEIAAGLVGQGLAILESVKKGISDESGKEASAKPQVVERVQIENGK